jgi:hypothetical protein
MEDGAEGTGGRAALLAERLIVGGVDLTILGPLRRVQPDLYSGGDLVAPARRRWPAIDLRGAQRCAERAHWK